MKGMGYRAQSAEHRALGDVLLKTGHLLAAAMNGLLRILALATIRFYQACLSPMFPAACRHYPTCSAYAYEAVEKWGIGKGGRLALGRLLRCRPWGSYGYDPVPERPVPGAGDWELEPDRR